MKNLTEEISKMKKLMRVNESLSKFDTSQYDEDFMSSTKTIIYEAEDEKIKYFDFGGIAKIPYVVGAKFAYLNNLETGEILGLDKKDKFGYYEDVFIENWGEPVRRYYPTNDWGDWAFVKDKKIPFSFITKDNKIFHLSIKLIDPTKSVTDLDNPNNKSRGWALTYPGARSVYANDSQTGYYSTEGSKEVPYNITTPVEPGELSTYDLDTRSGFDKFMDGTVGLIAQIVVAIVVTAITKNIALGGTAASALVSTDVVATRLFMASIVAEAIVNIPVAIYYFNRPGYESAGWMSLAFMMLPVINRYTPLRNILPDFSEKTCLEISERIMSSGMKTMDLAEAKAFMDTLPLKDKALFLQVAKKSNKIGSLIKQYESKLTVVSKESLEYLKYKEQIISLINKPTQSFFKSLVLDFSITYAFAKLSQKIIDQFSDYKKQKGESVDKMTEDERKKIAENVKKVEDAMKQLPSIAQTFAEKELPNIPTFELSDNAVVELCEKGIFSEEFKQKIYEGTAKYSTELLEASALEGASGNIKEITPELFEEINKFILDPEYKRLVTPERRKLLEDAIKQQAEKYNTTPISDVESDEIDKLISSTEGEPKTVTTTITPDEEIKYQWFDELKNEWVDTTISQYNARIKKGNKVREMIFNKDSKQWVEKGKELETSSVLSDAKINTTYDINFDYKLENDKYYIKGKGEFAKKYPDWKEVTGEITIDRIKRYVKFE
jgi:hypothetical protein